MMDNRILDSSNVAVAFVPPQSTTANPITQYQWDNLIMGLTGSGELGLKVVTIGSSSGSATTVIPKQYATVSNASVATANVTVFTLAAGEQGRITNLVATNSLLVKLGASASTSSFNEVLKGCAAQDDGTGGSITIDDYVGVVSVVASTGTARYLAYKLS